MPHVNIKHFAPALDNIKQQELIDAITQAVTHVTQCDPGVVSITIEPVDQSLWNDDVFIPEIVNEKKFLCKKPNY